MHTEPVSPRMTAEERRAELVDAAVEEFAQAGLAGASTEAIARRAGISHAYLFRLYPTKRALFAATVDDAFGHVLRTFQEAYEARDPAEPVLRVLGHAYIALIEDRSRLLFQLHAYAACGDEDIRKAVQRGYGDLYEFAERVSGGSDSDVRHFFAFGMLLNVMAAMELPSLDAGWARRLVADCMNPAEP